MDSKERWERRDQPPWAIREGIESESRVSTTRDSAAGPPAVWVVLLLLVLFEVTLHGAYFSIPDTVLRDFVHFWGLAKPCAALIDWLAPDAGLMAQVGGLVGPGVNLVILRGCDGVGMMFLLISATVAVALASRQWQTAALGLLAATTVSYVLNLLRITTLYFVVANQPAWFATAHNLVLPLVIVLVSGSFFLVWSNWLAVMGRRRSPA